MSMGTTSSRTTTAATARRTRSRSATLPRICSRTPSPMRRSSWRPSKRSTPIRPSLSSAFPTAPFWRSTSSPATARSWTAPSSRGVPIRRTPRCISGASSPRSASPFAARRSPQSSSKSSPSALTRRGSRAARGSRRTRPTIRRIRTIRSAGSPAPSAFIRTSSAAFGGSTPRTTRRS